MKTSKHKRPSAEGVVRTIEESESVTGSNTNALKPDVELYIVVAAPDVNDHKQFKKFLESFRVNKIVSSVYNARQLTALFLRKGVYNIEFPYQPQLVLLDLDLPHGKALKVLTEIKKNTSLSEMLICTFGNSESAEHLSSAEYPHIAMHLQRPLKLPLLRPLIERICASP